MAMFGFRNNSDNENWLLSAYTTNHKENPDSLLNLLIGKWKGKGSSNGIDIADTVEFKKVLDGKFIYMQIGSTIGDNFKAEGYLYYDAVKREIEFYEFSNVTDVRQFVGKALEQKIVLTEIPESKKMNLDFIFHPDGSFAIKEYTSKDVKVFERFARIN